MKVITNQSEVLGFKIMKIALILILCSFIFYMFVGSGLTKYFILIIVAIVVLYLIFKKKRHHHNPHHHHKHHHKHRHHHKRH